MFETAGFAPSDVTLLTWDLRTSVPLICVALVLMWYLSLKRAYLSMNHWIQAQDVLWQSWCFPVMFLTEEATPGRCWWLTFPLPAPGTKQQKETLLCTGTDGEAKPVFTEFPIYLARLPWYPLEFQLAANQILNVCYVLPRCVMYVKCKGNWCKSKAFLDPLFRPLHVC